MKSMFGMLSIKPINSGASQDNALCTAVHKALSWLAPYLHAEDDQRHAETTGQFPAADTVSREKSNAEL